MKLRDQLAHASRSCNAQRTVLPSVSLPELPCCCFCLYPLLGFAYFPRTDPGQFVINVKTPSGTRIELTEQYDQADGRTWSARVVPDGDLGMIVSNIGITPGLLRDLHPNSAPAHGLCAGEPERRSQDSAVTNTWTRVRGRLARDMPRGHDLFSIRRPGRCRAEPGHACADRCAGERVNSLRGLCRGAKTSRARSAELPGVSDVLIPQDMDYPVVASSISIASGPPGWGFPRKKWWTM